MNMWEILVPTVRNCGKPFRTRYHRVWDKKVREISGGLTIMSPVKGQWVNPDGVLFAERMIPCRFLADETQVDEIINMTLKYYDQEATLCYLISSNVKLVYRS